MLKKLIEKYRILPVQVRASFWFLICSFLQKGISVITTPIFTRLMTTLEYGQYNVFNSWLGIVTIIITLQLYSGVYVQGLVKNSENRRAYSSALQGLSLTLCVLWSLVYFAAYKFWNRVFDLTTVQMTSMLVMVWATAAFNFWAGEQRVEYKYQKLVLITLLVSIAKPLIGIIFVIHANDKVTARILGLALVELIGYSGLFCVQMYRGKKFYSAQYWKNAMLFNIPLIPHYLSQTVLSSADRIMISKMSNVMEAGIYSLAYSISQIMTLFNTALSQTLSPWMYQKIKDNKAKDISKIGYISIIIIAAVNLMLIAVAPEAVAIFAPVEYHEAIWVIPPIAMSVIFIFSYDLFAKFEFYFEKTKFIMFASMSGAVLNIILNYIFIPQFGYVAAAYTTLVCYALYAMMHFIFMKKICKSYINDTKVYDGKKLCMIYGLFIVSGFILMGTYSNRLLRYIIILGGMVAVFVKRNIIINTVASLLKLKKKSKG